MADTLKPTGKYTTNEDFIRAWQGSSSVEEVQQKTGMDRGQALRRRNYLRKNKVGLKLLNERRTSRPDFDRLAKLAEDALA